MLASLVSLLLGTVMMSIFGPRGYLAYLDQLKRKDRITQKMEGLEEEKLRLESEFDAFLREPARVALAARSLGYYHQDEKVLIVNGKTVLTEIQGHNEILLEEDSDPMYLEGFFRLLGVLIFLTTLAFFETVDWIEKKKGGRTSRPQIKEIPGDYQTLSQTIRG